MKIPQLYWGIFIIDDNEKLLDIAVEKGLDVRLMDRENKVSGSKYQIIKDLKLDSLN